MWPKRATILPHPLLLDAISNPIQLVLGVLSTFKFDPETLVSVDRPSISEVRSVGIVLGDDR